MSGVVLECKKAIYSLHVTCRRKAPVAADSFSSLSKTFRKRHDMKDLPVVGKGSTASQLKSSILVDVYLPECVSHFPLPDRHFSERPAVCPPVPEAHCLPSAWSYLQVWALQLGQTSVPNSLRGVALKGSGCLLMFPELEAVSDPVLAPLLCLPLAVYLSLPTEDYLLRSLFHP